METNTASCGGFPGLSDSFGAALWVLDVSSQFATLNFSGSLLHFGGQNTYYNVSVCLCPFLTLLIISYSSRSLLLPAHCFAKVANGLLALLTMLPWSTQKPSALQINHRWWICFQIIVTHLHLGMLYLKMANQSAHYLLIISRILLAPMTILLKLLLTEAVLDVVMAHLRKYSSVISPPTPPAINFRSSMPIR